MTAENTLRKYWSYIVAVVAVCVWLIRLEGKVNFIEKVQETEGKRMATAIEKMGIAQERMAGEMSEMKTTLAGILGYEKGRDEAKRSRR